MTINKEKNKHTNTLKGIRKRIKEEKIVFIDQFGKFHKLYEHGNNQEVLYEIPCYIPTMSPVDISINKMRADEYEKWNLKDYFIPDLSIIKDKKYSYWIETVKTHPCSDRKMKFIKEFNFPTLEFSVYDFDYANKKRIIPCFDLSRINEHEYKVVKKYYKYRDKMDELYSIVIDLFMSRTDVDIFSKLNDKIDNLLLNKGIEKQELMNNNLPIAENKTSQPENTIEPTKTKVEKNIELRYPNVFERLESIMSIAIPELKIGKTLDAKKLAERCLEPEGLLSFEDETNLRRRINYKIRRVYKMSILNIASERYFDETLSKFNLKRRESVIIKSIASEVMTFNDELAKREQ